MKYQQIICRWKRSSGLPSYLTTFLVWCMLCYFLYTRDISLYQFKGNISHIFPQREFKDTHSSGDIGETPQNTRKGEYELSGPYFLEGTKNALSGNDTISASKLFAISKASTDNTTFKETFMQMLAYDLQHKLVSVTPDDTMDIAGTCGERLSRENSCQKGGCLQLTLPKAPIHRIAQLMEPTDLHLHEKSKNVLKIMGDSVPDFYDIILVTAASKNHFEESKVLLYNLHENVYPYLKNFTLIYYDLGLTNAQRDDISQMCRCHLKDFPFSHFTQTFSLLKCYIWKPVIIHAHASHCNILHWMDASIRFFDNPSKLEELYRLARTRGLQTGATSNKIAKVTLKSMFHFFGDEPCSYHKFTQCTAASLIFHNEPLIRYAVLNPWAACALNESCMCPYNKELDVKEARMCENIKKGNEYDYGVCHRFDQSALSIIVRKIFQEKSHHILRPDIKSFFNIKRGDNIVMRT